MSPEIAGEAEWLRSDDFAARDPAWLRCRLELTADLLERAYAAGRADGLEEAILACNQAAGQHPGAASIIRALAQKP